ncbi:MAG TPA: CDP-glucose 4,6-dehydratase [Candidatus Acidoferrales bacterium]|nr:CDP-glucose 4,6-dehydratase [Candidatus Acidoferrales bacterium]
MAALVSSSFWSGKRVFLTGHTGFKGSWLALRLVDLGASVSGYALAPEWTPNAFELLGIEKKTDSTFADIRDLVRLRNRLAHARADVVFHLAAQPLVRRGYREPRETFETNVMGTVNLLEVIREQPSIGAVLVVTSDKTYANRDARPHREDDPLGGDDPYSASKACTEIVVDAYRHSYFTSGTRLATARAGNVIGGGDFSEDRLVPDMVRASEREEPVALRYPNATRPWQFVGDALDGYLTIVEQLWNDTSVARAWNLGPSHSEMTVCELAKRFLAVYDSQTKIVIDSAPAPPEAPYLALDTSDAQEILGWRPRYDAAGAIDATSAWYRAWREGKDLVEITLAQLRGAVSSPR